MGISLSRARLSSLVGLCVLLAACGGDDGPATSSTTPINQTPGNSPDDNAIKNSTPTLLGTPPPAVVPGSEYSFAPKGSDADGDILTFSIANAPPWSAFQPSDGTLKGTPGPGDIGTYENVMIKVSDGAADASLDPFSITVAAAANGAMELSWEPPTENVDGTPLTDLTGYKLYWGTTPGEYPNSVTVDNAGIVTYVLDNLVPATYYFVATAYNSEGAESEPSEMATGTLM